MTVTAPSERQRALAVEALAHLRSPLALIRPGDGVIVYTNESWNDMFGYADGEVTGQHVSVVHLRAEEETPGDRLRAIVRSLDAVGVWSGDLESMRGDGSQVVHGMQISRFESDRYGEIWITVCGPAESG